ncbi:hypothetical protein B0H16DRAFT_1738337 [Mycena metata]|uniref:Uncharacterized protein n=1 Tax=Mycena metata TaxID=1033252 RepID=A0AAD7HI59_9AGAR|nr:hypothetical protein B0H16DRAFT_1745740 [Mycena metata]KAJ7721293.1 hypothetical protein B0H16DRAFT_1738337 [Mycena metata]
MDVSTDVPPNPALTSREDKALKREAIQKHGQADTPKLKQWLAHYQTPRRAALYARVAARAREQRVDPGPRKSPAPPKITSAERRAALYARVAARKQRIDELMECRRRAVANSLKRPIPPPCHPAVERLRVAQSRAREATEKAAQRAVEHEAERIKAEARVNYLLSLCAAGKENRR